MITRRPGGPFSTTRWTLVTAAAQHPDGRGSDALAELCNIYWSPLYSYLRGRGYPREEAQDLTQGFFARLLETRALRAADPNRGRFRAFLLTALRHYAINEYQKGVTAKRGGREAQFAPDFEGAERAYAADPRRDENPEHLFERRWAFIVLERALQRLRKECEAPDRGGLQVALLPYLTDSAEQRPYREVAAEFHVSEGAVRVAVHRLRQRYADMLRAEIAETVANDDDVEAEMRELLRVVAS